MNKVVIYNMKRIRSLFIQIPLILIIIVTSMAVPAATSVSAGELEENGLESGLKGGPPTSIEYDNVGFYIPGQTKWYLKNNQIDGWVGLSSIGFGGSAELVPVTGDWDNDTDDNVGFYKPSAMRWYLKNNASSGWSGVTSFFFGGAAEMIPVTGDWDGDGDDTVGFYKPSTMRWYLKNDLTSGWAGVATIGFGGTAEMIPVTGDWDGDGDDNIGFYVPSTMRWYLKSNEVSGWSGVTSFFFGGAAELIPVAGDWDGDGEDTVGFYKPSAMRWYLKNNTSNGWTGITSIAFGGAADMTPVIGNWDGDPNFYTNQVMDSILVSAGANSGVSVQCTSDGVVVGGGYAADDGLLIHHQRMYENGWIVYAKNNTGSSKQVNVYANCLYNVPGQTKFEFDQVSVPALDSDNAEASCPIGSVVTGGGWASNQSGTLRIYNSSPMDPIDGWEVWAENLSASPELLNSYAVCLSGVETIVDDVLEVVSISPGYTGSASPVCPLGEHVTGGGFAVQPDLEVYNTSRDAIDNQWNSYALNTGLTSGTMFGYAVCVWFP